MTHPVTAFLHSCQRAPCFERSAYICSTQGYHSRLPVHGGSQNNQRVAALSVYPGKAMAARVRCFLRGCCYHCNLRYPFLQLATGYRSALTSRCQSQHLKSRSTKGTRMPTDILTVLLGVVPSLLSSAYCLSSNRGGFISISMVTSFARDSKHRTTTHSACELKRGMQCSPDQH